MGSISQDACTPSPVYQVQPLATGPAPTLYLIRHAQAEHNVSASHAHRRDTILTETGRAQAAKLRAILPESSRRQIGALVASPLRRALLTALIGFEDLLIGDATVSTTNGVSKDPAAIEQRQIWTDPLRLIALPEAQESNEMPCDVGLPLADLVAEVDAPESEWRGRVSFDLVAAEEWGIKTGRWSCEPETLRKRAIWTRRWLREKMRQLSLEENDATTELAEKPYVRADCVLVTHGGFLHFLTEDWGGFDHKAGTGWSNTEVRAYQFVNGLESTADANATITETEQSLQARSKGESLGAEPTASEEPLPAMTSLAAMENEAIRAERR